MNPVSTPEAQEERKSRIPSWLRVAGLIGMVAILLPFTLWGGLALYYDLTVPSLRLPLVILYLLAVVAAWVFVKPRWLGGVATLGAFVLVLAWWFSLKPSNTRDWQTDMATLAYATFEGNRVTLHNIRNCDYRTETDFDVRHYDKTFDLDKLRTLDLYMVYWGSPYMAHTMMSFGFEGGDYVCFSIETRKEKGEGYSAIKGCFRQFELMYIVADERDLVRLRTNYRQGEEAYLFRFRSSPEQVRTRFLEYLKTINSLKEMPRWYNAIGDNCTTSIRAQRAASERTPWDWRLLVNGFGDQLLYERGTIPTNLPMAELKEKCHINARARAADKAPDFSRLIREGVPGIRSASP